MMARPGLNSNQYLQPETPGAQGSWSVDAG